VWHNGCLSLQDKALERDPDNFLLLYLKGVELLKSRKSIEEITRLAKSAALNPDYAPGWMCKGSELQAAKRCGKAVEAFNMTLLSNQTVILLWALKCFAFSFGQDLRREKTL